MNGHGVHLVMEVVPSLWQFHYNPHTPCLRLTASQGECELQMAKLIQQLYLKSTLPLCYMLVKSITEGVRISHEIVHWTNLFEINMPPGRPGKKMVSGKLLAEKFLTWREMLPILDKEIFKWWEILPCWERNLASLAGKLTFFPGLPQLIKFAAIPPVLIVGIPEGPVSFIMRWIWWNGGSQNIPFWIN